MVNFLEEMAKSMKPGVRVKRRRYWNYVGIDGYILTILHHNEE